MILVDSGPLVALIDADEERHADCRTAIGHLAGPMLTTWPVLTEAMHLLGTIGWHAQTELWQMVEAGRLELAAQGTSEAGRMKVLMEKYRDRPMELADASLVVLAEDRGLRDVFTLDQGDFRIYRPHRRQSFRLWP